MKKILIITIFMTLTSSAHAQESWWQSLLNTVGLGNSETVSEKAEDSVSIEGLIRSLTSNLGVTTEQAQGGIAAIFNYAKQNVSPEQFASLAAKIPGLDSVMQYLPKISEAKESGLGGLLDMASGMSEQLSQANDLKKQFDTLGLDTNMISSYVNQASSYLDTPQGAEAKKMLGETFSSLSL